MSEIGWLERNFKIYGVDLYGHADPMPGPGTTTINFKSPPEWDRSGFFDSASPTRVTVPSGYRGRYTIRMTIQWNRGGAQPFTIQDRDQGFFYGEFSTNAHPDGHFQESRVSAAPVVNSTKTVFHLLWEGLLAPGHYIEPLIQYQLPQPASMDAWLRMRRLGRQ
jgi:hypothetical protein